MIRAKAAVIHQDMENQHDPQPSTTPNQRADSTGSEQPKQITIRNAENCFYRLWEASADHLNEEQLHWFSSLIELTERQAADLSYVVEGIGGMVNDDDNTGSFSSKKSISTLLFNINNQLETITGLIHVSSSAAYRLSNPELYHKAETNGGAE